MNYTNSSNRLPKEPIGLPIPKEDFQHKAREAMREIIARSNGKKRLMEKMAVQAQKMISHSPTV